MTQCYNAECMIQAKVVYKYFSSVYGTRCNNDKIDIDQKYKTGHESSDGKSGVLQEGVVYGKHSTLYYR